MFDPKETEESKEDQDLHNYLMKLGQHLSDLNLEQRGEIIQDVKRDLITSMQASGQNLKKVRKSLGPERDFLNPFLLKRGLPPLEKKKGFSFLKFFIYTFSGFTILGVLSVLLFLNSITPLFKIDEKTRTLSLFGGNIVLEQDDETFFSRKKNQSQFSFSSQLRELSGEIPIEDFHKVTVEGDKVDIAFRGHGFQSLNYKCQSNQDELEHIKNLKGELILSFEGTLQCLIKLPEGVVLEGEFQEGFLNFRSMRNPVDVKMKQGVVSWVAGKDKELYHMDFEVEEGKVQGKRPEDQEEAVYQAKIRLERGKISVRGH